MSLRRSEIGSLDPGAVPGASTIDTPIKTPTVFFIGCSWLGIKYTNTDILRSVYL